MRACEPFVVTLCPTFRDACVALGLLGDDREWEQAMTDADVWATPKDSVLRREAVVVVTG